VTQFWNPTVEDRDVSTPVSMSRTIAKIPSTTMSGITALTRGAKAGVPVVNPIATSELVRVIK
jgi:hypothetical protein